MTVLIIVLNSYLANVSSLYCITQLGVCALFSVNKALCMSGSIKAFNHSSRVRPNRIKSDVKVTKLIPALHGGGAGRSGGGGLQPNAFQLKVSREYQTTTSAAGREGKRRRGSK